MKEHTPLKGILIVTVVLAAIAVTVVSFRAVWAQQSRPQSTAPDPDDRRALIEAIRRGGYKAAAKLKGHYVGKYDPHWDWAQYDIEMLTKYSEVVAVVVPSKKLGGHLSFTGQEITTDYEVSVKASIKGPVQEGSTIRVSIPGGRVEFEDGTSAELRPLNFQQMELDKTYTLFLNQDQTREMVFVLTAGPQGLVETPADGGSVKSHARPTDPIAKQANGMDAEAFHKEVRSQAQKWPLPLKCCSQ